MTKSPYFSAEEAKTQLTVLNIYYRPEFIQYPSDIAKQCEWIRELLNRCLTGANRIDPYGEAEVITKTLLNDLLLCRR